ncbi:MAG: DUF790 family protein [Thermomicrobiales bacterium]
MAFRRQDIPKTTRKSADDGQTRVHPRFLRDHSLEPKLELAIDYLDGMVGRRRGDLSPDTLVELFGDPKLARCLLTCMQQSYVYRESDFADIIGGEAASSLAGRDIASPSDLRGHLYLAANATRHGFVVPSDRDAFLADVGVDLGVDGASLDELLHLDAERNAVLVRVGPRPQAADVVARYNVTLVLSMLRHASSVVLELPGLHDGVIAAVCRRHEVERTTTAQGSVRLEGRRNAMGGWSTFGSRLSRCALQLIVLSPETPAVDAKVHLGDRSLSFVPDAKTVGLVRPKRRLAAGPSAMLGATALAEEIALFRKSGGDMNGWRVRRRPEPIVVDGALSMPELAFTRGHVTVGAHPVPCGNNLPDALAVLEIVGRSGPVISIGREREDASDTALAADDPIALVKMLDALTLGSGVFVSPLESIAQEIAATGWTPMSRLSELQRDPAEVRLSLQRLSGADDVLLTPGFGLCRGVWLDGLRERLMAGPIDIAALRREIAAEVGDAAGADALTLYLLANPAPRQSDGSSRFTHLEAA